MSIEQKAREIAAEHCDPYDYDHNWRLVHLGIIEALQARVDVLEAALREIRDCTEKHGGAATALKIIRATLEGSGND